MGDVTRNLEISEKYMNVRIVQAENNNAEFKSGCKFFELLNLSMYLMTHSITERAFDNLLVQGQFLTESLNFLSGIFFVAFMMLGCIFSKIVDHSVPHSVAFDCVKACV